MRITNLPEGFGLGKSDIGPHPGQNRKRPIARLRAGPTSERERHGAGNEIRTRDPKLGKLVLYQLSYARPFGSGNYDNSEDLSTDFPGAIPDPPAATALRNRTRTISGPKRSVELPGELPAGFRRNPTESNRPLRPDPRRRDEPGRPLPPRPAGRCRCGPESASPRRRPLRNGYPVRCRPPDRIGPDRRRVRPRPVPPDPEAVSGRRSHRRDGGDRNRCRRSFRPPGEPPRPSADGYPPARPWREVPGPGPTGW